jgi:chemotaxis response regulator CheB
MAFILVPHLDPGYPSMLTEILQRITPLTVVEAGNGMPEIPQQAIKVKDAPRFLLFRRCRSSSPA